ncbi:hypothetical protein R5R35_010183 [Gryllus longicercus]|uniref:Fatty acyl-CoA reductase n=1 Tax=Gryllus longicercus TaxID=2509291 RepID=A0AAN9VMV1_9ORTH
MGTDRGSETPGDAGAERGRVASCFAGKDVFVTGGSGFVGRVLIEKLLREAPDVGTIFVLVRAKKGVPARERVHNFTQVSLFDGLRRQQPHALSKVQGVEGDVALLGLGLSDGDRKLLEERVAFVFHAAASVRFNDPLPKAVCLNTRGTSELCEMALRMRRLEAFIYVSTAYTNCNRLEIDEKLYPPPGDWRTFNELVDKMDPLLLDILTPKLVGNSINTYIFTKALAEDVVNDYRHQLPIGIIRPSIVCPSAEEPFPGWTDNFYGPTTVLLGNGMGALHVNLADPEVDMNLIPVDYVVRAIMLLAIKLAVHRSTGTLPVYNATSHNRQLLKLHTIKESMYSCLAELRLPRVYKWFSLILKNVFIFRILFILIDLPIAIALDCIAWCTNQPTRMIKVHRRSIVAQLKNHYFSHNTFKFYNSNYLSLNETLGPKEKQRYRLTVNHILWEPLMLLTQHEIKNYFFPKNAKNPGPITVLLEFVHFIICGILLLLVWKSSCLTPLIRISFNILKLLLPLPIIQLIF